MMERNDVTPITEESEQKPLSKLQKKNGKPSHKDNWELIPPDGGWGWLILAGNDDNKFYYFKK